MIKYTDSLKGINLENLHGFFVGWPEPPSPETHFRILKNSSEIVLALDNQTGNVIGFINAISDQVLTAYIPLLEVLPDYQEKGIGKMLMSKMMKKLTGYYVIDLICDPERKSFYQQFGFKPLQAMGLRNYEMQSGKEN
ncbi:MAG: GNAT family N-acetyltransferase [Anaerolineaceae bacterium]|nr:GNAT family N-acetyltransferase [Anaerolineaceae bacterium]